MKHHFYAVALAGLTAIQPSMGQEGPAFQVNRISYTPSGIQLEWTNAGDDQVYTVQRRDPITPGIWLNAKMDPWPTPLTQWTDPSPRDSGFYRVLAMPQTDRGNAMSDTLIDSLTTTEIRFFFQVGDIPVEPEFGVDIYKLVYQTLGVLGEPEEAAGLLFLPQNPPQPLPLASYQHGTILLENEAPSIALELESEAALGVAFATTGYAAVLPDYLGLDGSPDLHPYHHAQSEATACVDMLRAARNWCTDHQIDLNGQLFLLGYSQGGHATMALHRELESRHADEFTVTASAPMAGAYDLSGATAQDLLSVRPMPNPDYVAYLLAAYQQVYRFAPHWSEWLADPYAETLPPLLDGQTDSDIVNGAMPSRLEELFTPEAFQAFQNNPRHPLRVALRDNDLIEWTPQAPTRLYHCPEDEDVVFENAESALQSFHDRGATHVELIVPDPDGDHDSCNEPSLLDAKAWFDSLRQ